MDSFNRMAMIWKSADKIRQACERLEERYQLDPLLFDRVKDALAETEDGLITKETQERLYPALVDFMEACALAVSDAPADRQDYQALADLFRALPLAGPEELSDT